MQLEAEFTSEPFRGEGTPPEHAVRARDAAEEAGLDTDFGPFGTLARGDSEELLEALPAIAQAAFDGGATRITLQLRRTADTASTPFAGPSAAGGGPADRSNARSAPAVKSHDTARVTSTSTAGTADAVPTGQNDPETSRPSEAPDTAGVPAIEARDTAHPAPAGPSNAAAAGQNEAGSTPAVELNGALVRLIADVERELGAELGDLDRLGKQRAVRLLRERGAFGLRKSVSAVADALGVTRFTVYNYLNRETD